MLIILSVVSCGNMEQTGEALSERKESLSSSTDQQVFDKNEEQTIVETIDGGLTENDTEKISETSETTVNDQPLETDAETTSETAMSPEDRYNLGLEYVMNYRAVIVAGDEEYEPYTSTVYYQNPYMVGDGLLMFVSMENQLPHWIDACVIPHISLHENSDVRFEYHEDAELTHTGKFRIYAQYENGVVTKIKEFANAELAEVYAYGKEHLAGKTVYITYPFMLQYGDYSDVTDGTWGDRAVHDIMCIFVTAF